MWPKEDDEKKIAVALIKNEIELYVDIYCKFPLKACRIRFREVNPNKDLYKQDKLGDGLLTMTINQARNLRNQLSVILETPQLLLKAKELKNEATNKVNKDS